MPPIALAYVTCPSREEALRIAGHLLERELIACGNLIPISSIYRWKGDVQAEDEVVLIAKTTEAGFPAVRAAVAEIHPYELPCILRLGAEANEPFAAWVAEEVKGS